jgi:hypothetical protein
MPRKANAAAKLFLSSLSKLRQAAMDEEPENDCHFGGACVLECGDMSPLLKARTCPRTP